MKELLSSDHWARVADLARKHKRIRAAIAYVTADHIAFGSGDTLICDASDEAIQGANTSASTLRCFHDNGADLFSFPGLHAKVAVIDECALIGSANLSETAGIRTCEASLLTDDPQLVAMVLGFVEQVKRKAEPITKEFLQRIAALPVTKRAVVKRTKNASISVGQSRVWLIATKPLSERLIEAEKAHSSVGEAEARSKLAKPDDDVDWIRWTGRSHFRTQAKPGDIVIQVFSEQRGKRKHISVFDPAPIIHRQDRDNWTRFYLEVPPEQLYQSWKSFVAELKKVGMAHITPNVTRELTGRAEAILQLM